MHKYSNNKETQIVLDQFGLASFFSAVVGGDRLPTRKPDPAMLHLVMQELAVDHCLFVGDSEVDVATAKAAGMPVALFTKGYRQTPVADLAPEFHFDDYRVLPAIAETFNSYTNVLCLVFLKFCKLHTNFFKMQLCNFLI